MDLSSSAEGVRAFVEKLSFSGIRGRRARGTASACTGTGSETKSVGGGSDNSSSFSGTSNGSFLQGRIHGEMVRIRGLHALEGLWRFSSLLEQGRFMGLDLRSFALQRSGDREGIPFLDYFGAFARPATSWPGVFVWVGECLPAVQDYAHDPGVPAAGESSAELYRKQD